MNIFALSTTRMLLHFITRPVRPSAVAFVGLIVIACSASPPREPVGSDGASKSSITAVDDGFFKVVTSAAATTKIAGIDGIAVDWNRFNNGSGFVTPGVRKILVRLWGENKSMKLPYGTPIGKVESFGCIAFEAKSNRSYEVSSVAGDSNYSVTVTEISDAAKTRKAIHAASVPFDSAATLATCR